MVFSDALNHASIVDGCRLVARGDVRLRPLRHRPPRVGPAPGRGPRLADRDRRRLLDGRRRGAAAEIVELAQRYDARVMVDEAHGTGAIGPDGRGAVAEAGLEDEVDVIVGTLGKALGSYGAYVCCDQPMAKYLINTARTLIFSTALPPPAVAAAMAALELLREQPRRVEKLQRNAAVLREALADQGLPVPETDDADRAADRRRRGRGREGERASARAGRVRTGDPPADRARRHLAPAARGDGVAHEVRAARGRAGAGARCVPGRGRAAVRRTSQRLRRPRATPPSRCAASSSPAPTPGSASPSWPQRSARRWSRAASGWPPSSRWSPAWTRRPASSAARPRAARRGGERGSVARRTWRRTASGRRCRRTTPPSWPVSRSSRRGCVGRARGRHDAARLRGRRRPAGADHARLSRARPGRRPRAAGGDRRAHRARHDQPHAADGRGGARRRPERGRRRDDALAGRAE